MINVIAVIFVRWWSIYVLFRSLLLKNIYILLREVFIMRKYIILCAVILTLLISGCSSNTENVDVENTDDTIKFRVGMGNSEDHQHYAGLEKMIEVLEEERSEER